MSRPYRPMRPGEVVRKGDQIKGIDGWTDCQITLGIVLTAHNCADFRTRRV